MGSRYVVVSSIVCDRVQLKVTDFDSIRSIAATPPPPSINEFDGGIYVEAVHGRKGKMFPERYTPKSVLAALIGDGVLCVRVYVCGYAARAAFGTAPFTGDMQFDRRTATNVELCACRIRSAALTVTGGINRHCSMEFDVPIGVIIPTRSIWIDKIQRRRRMKEEPFLILLLRFSPSRTHF